MGTAADQRRRRILTAVAEGRLSPAEAAALLDRPGVDEWTADADHPAHDCLNRDCPRHGRPGGGGDGDGDGDGAAAEVRAAYRAVTVVGDPGVSEVAVEGPHAVRREGDRLVVACEEELRPGSWQFAAAHGARLWAGPMAAGAGLFGIGHPQGPWGPFRMDEGDPPRWQWAVPGRRGRALWYPGWGLAGLRVRVHPDRPLTVHLAFGSLSVEGVSAPVRLDASAASCRLRGLVGPFDLAVQGGAVSARGRIDSGESRIRCHTGSVILDLDPDSDVAIDARAHVSRVTVLGETAAHGLSRTLGRGTGSLDIDCHLGGVTVSVAPVAPMAGEGERP